MDASKNDKKTDNDFVSKTSISLDKNELMKAIMPHVENRSNEGTSNSPAVFFEKVADQIKSDGVLLGVNHQLPNIGSKDMPAGISSQTAIPVTDFAPEVSEWIGRYIRVSAGESGSTAAKFSLYPEHLGHVEIKITTNQGHVSAQIVTDTPLAKEALEGQIQHLRQSLQQQGLIVQKLDVVQQTSETNVLNQANMSFSQSGSYSSREQQNSRSSQDVSKKRQDTGQKEVENESLAISYGGAVKNSASRIDFTA